MSRLPVRSAFVAVSVSALVAAGCGGAGKPNVVLVVVDSLRADGLGCYGDKPSASPQIDTLCAEGVRFDRAVAQAPWNVPSISSLLTSTYPWKNGRGVADVKPGDVATLAEALAKNGYRTGAFTEATWPLIQRGFQSFENTAGADVFGDPKGSSAAKTFAAALAWMRKDDKQPFFAMIHTYEAHSWFLGKPAHHAWAKRELPDYRGRFADWGIRDLAAPAGPQVIDALLAAGPEDVAYARALYRGAIAEVDKEVGALAAELEKAGLDQRTVVVLTSSNGEGFRPDLKRVHHAGRLHDDLLRVPLVVRWPGHVTAGTSTSLVELKDTAPTVLALAGLPAEPLFAGRALFAADTGFLARLRGPRFTLRTLPAQPAVAEDATFATLPSGQRTNASAPQLVLYSDWATLVDAGDHVELYDLKADPRQEKDVADKHRDVAASLREQLKRFASEAGPGQAPDSAQLEQLRSLGYVQ
jgi:arylsulfatase A-like enzyme